MMIIFFKIAVISDFSHKIYAMGMNGFHHTDKFKVLFYLWPLPK